MIRLLIAGAASIGLILLLTLIVSRLIRSRQQGLSVRMQVFLALAGIVGAFSFGLGILVIDRVEARAERLAVAAARDEAHAVAAILQSEMKRTLVSFDSLARELMGRSPRLFREGGEVDEMGRLGIEFIGLGGHLLYPAAEQSQAQEEGAVFVDAAVMSQGQVVGTVRIVKPTIVVQAMLKDLAPTILVISLILGAAAAGAAAWIGRTIAAPIEALRDYSQKVSVGERPEVPTEVRGREVARLVESIDTMRKRLEGRPFVETFAADLSHELKNPVAAIRASSEVLLEGALAEPEQASRFVEGIKQAAARIEKLLAELLSLAQIETRGPEHRGKVLLQPLIEEILDGYPQSSTKRITLALEPKLATKGDPQWLSRALSNLIDNALVHSPSEAPIKVELRSQGTELFFSTRNQGSLDSHIQNSLFRRFVTTRRDRGGTGLGLSIVQAVAEAHGGQVELLNPGPPEVHFQMRLPSA